MQSDRELLEAAAKAAGYRIHAAHQAERDSYGDASGLWIVNVSTCWNPLRDDGEAFTLQVLLDLELYLGDDEGAAMYAGGYSGPHHDIRRSYMAERLDEHGGNRLKAARRAIVRAAAATGAST